MVGRQDYLGTIPLERSSFELCSTSKQSWRRCYQIWRLVDDELIPSITSKPYRHWHEVKRVANMRPSFAVLGGVATNRCWGCELEGILGLVINLRPWSTRSYAFPVVLYMGIFHCDIYPLLSSSQFNTLKMGSWWSLVEFSYVSCHSAVASPRKLRLLDSTRLRWTTGMTSREGMTSDSISELW